MAQISFSFNGGFWPISFPLFHGTTRPSALGAVLVAACMNGSLVGGKELHVDPASTALADPKQPHAPRQSGPSPQCQLMNSQEPSSSHARAWAIASSYESERPSDSAAANAMAPNASRA